MSGLTTNQYSGLLRPIAADRVSKDPKGHAHVEAWDIRRHLIRIFGFGGWDFSVVDCQCIGEVTHQPQDANAKPRYSVAYRVIGRLTIRTADGATLCTYEDGATGDATNQPSFGDAHDMALKTALSQALKRCAANLGDQFGLGLYNDGRTDAVVKGSYVFPVVETAEPAAEDEPKPGGITKGTNAKMFALFGALGIKDTVGQHQFADVTLNRTNVSFKALTEADAKVLIAALESRLDKERQRAVEAQS